MISHFIKNRNHESFHGLKGHTGAGPKSNLCDLIYWHCPLGSQPSAFSDAHVTHTNSAPAETYTLSPSDYMLQTKYRVSYSLHLCLNLNSPERPFPVSPLNTPISLLSPFPDFLFHRAVLLTWHYKHLFTKYLLTRVRAEIPETKPVRCQAITA